MYQIFIVGHQILGDDDKDEKRQDEFQAHKGLLRTAKQLGQVVGDNDRQKGHNGKDVVVELGGTEGKEDVGHGEAQEGHQVFARTPVNIIRFISKETHQGHGKEGGPGEGGVKNLPYIQVEGVVWLLDQTCGAFEMVVDEKGVEITVSELDGHKDEPGCGDREKNQESLAETHALKQSPVPGDKNIDADCRGRQNDSQQALGEHGQCGKHPEAEYPPRAIGIFKQTQQEEGESNHLESDVDAVEDGLPGDEEELRRGG